MIGPKYEIWSEMGPYGSVGAQINTAMAHDHFQTPPDTKRGYKTTQKSQKILKVRAKPAKSMDLKLSQIQLEIIWVHY